MSRVWSLALLACVGVAAGGCHRRPAPSSPVAVQPMQVWRPDPARAGELTVVGKVGRYQLRLPTGYTPLPVDPATANLPAGSVLVAWHKLNTDSNTPTSVVAVTGTDPAMVAEAKDPAKVLNESILSAAVECGIWPTSVKLDPVETGVIAGIPFARQRWSAVGNPAQGYAYTAADGNSVVSFVTTAVTPGMADLQAAAIATLTKP